MNCPKCNKDWACGCKSCKSRPNESGLKTSTFGVFESKKHGLIDYEQCPYCDNRFHPDQLLDHEWKLMKRDGLV